VQLEGETAARTITHTDFFDYTQKAVNKKTVNYDSSHAWAKICTAKLTFPRDWKAALGKIITGLCRFFWPAFSSLCCFSWNEPRQGELVGQN
jgi:hypothetical protein